MNFLEFEGNPELKATLGAAVDRGAMSHAYIIHGPRGSGKRTLAAVLAAAAVCSGAGERPCGHCSHCRKALSGIHPDIITVDAGGKDLGVAQIRDLRRDAYIKPNEAGKKVYILPDGAALNFPAQNAMLKLLEEGAPFIVFLILAENPASLLPTVRSRCVELGLGPLKEDELAALLHRRFPDRPAEELLRAAQWSEGLAGPALEALNQRPEEAASGGEERAAGLGAALCRKEEKALLFFCVGLEKMNRDELASFLEQSGELMLESLRIQAGAPGGKYGETAEKLAICLTKAQIIGTIDVIRRLRGYCDFNVGVGHALAVLAADCWEMIG